MTIPESPAPLKFDSTFYGDVVVLQPMSTWSRSDLEKVAALAKLSLTEEEISLRLKEFADILGHIDTLSQAPIEEAVRFETISCEMHPDEVQPSMPIEDVLSNATQPSPPFFTIPKVIDGEGS